MFHKVPRYHWTRFVVTTLALVCLAGWATSSSYSRSESATSDTGRKASASRRAAAKSSDPTKPSEATRAQVRETYGKLPISFEANQGQADSRAQFLSRGSGYTLFLTSNEAVLAVKKPSTLQDHRQPAVDDGVVEGQAARMQSAILRMKLVGGNSAPQVKGQDELLGKSNYFIGNDPSKWRTNVANYARVRYEDVYPGISLEYHGNQRQLEYDFVIAPGADPRSIKLAFEGAGKTSIARNGDLVLQTPRGKVRQPKPVVYQEVNGVKQMIDGRYVIREKNRVCFAVTGYDASKPLVIDPVFQYSTYLGGSGEDDADAIAVDSSGNTYIGGVTSSINFPTTPGALQTAHSGTDYDGYVAKLNATGSAVVYATYLGGSADDFLNSIAVDAAGNAYVGGQTGSPDFPTTASAFSTILHGGPDAFFAKLNDTGSVLVYSTYLGSSGVDNINPIALDPAGNAYVTGFTRSASPATDDFPTTAGAYKPTKPTRNSDSFPDTIDAFVAKFDPTASGVASLVYSTYLGGGGPDTGFGIAVDSTGAAYVSGGTKSTFVPPPFPPDSVSHDSGRLPDGIRGWGAGLRASCLHRCDVWRCLCNQVESRRLRARLLDLPRRLHRGLQLRAGD